jgi:uncharacterized membrane protein YjjP (DUF1212 family)
MPEMNTMTTDGDLADGALADGDLADEALRLACDAGRIILESGGETYRSEDVVLAVATALGGIDADAFATPTGIIVSCQDATGRSLSMVRRIRKRQMNLDKLVRVNSLAREAVAGTKDLDGVQRELCTIDAAGGYSGLVQALGSAAITGFFCLFFGGGWQDALVAGFIGLSMGRVTSWFRGMRISDFFVNIVGGAFAAGAAIAAIQLGLGQHQDMIIIGAIMLLVPGVTIVNAIRDTIAGDLVAGIARGADAFISAAGISIGVGLALQTSLTIGRIAA